MKKICVFLLGVVMCITGCQKKEQVVKIAYLPVLSSSQLYVGIVKNYFEEEGIKVEISEIYNGPDIVTAVLSKSIDIGVGVIPPLIRARSNGMRVKSIGGATFDGISVQEHRIMLPIDSEIQTAQDLRGQKIAVVAEGTSDYFSLIYYLKTNGIEKEEVEIIAIPHSEMIFAITSKSVDAAAGAEPFITMGAVEEKTRTFDYYYPDYEVEVATFIAHEDFINANPELIAKIAKVIEKSTAIINNESEFRQLLPSLNKHGIKLSISEEVAYSLRLMGFRSSLTKQGFEAVLNMLYDNSILNNKINFEDCIYTPVKNE